MSIPSEEKTQEEPHISKEGWLARSIKTVPEQYRFPLVLTFIILVAGSGVILASTNEFRLIGLVVVVFGLGSGAYLFQNAQNTRNSDTEGLNKTYDLTIVVLSPDRQPVHRASVTVLGPVSFVDKKTKKDGRVTYKYTGREMQSYRNRPIEIQASYEDCTASEPYELKPQSGDMVDVQLQCDQAVSTMKNTGEIKITMGMDRETFAKIVDLVDDFVATTSSRQALLNQAFWGDPIVKSINVSGSSHDFTTHLITELHNRGGEDSVVQLLETLKEQVGTSRQGEIDVLITSVKE